MGRDHRRFRHHGVWAYDNDSSCVPYDVSRVWRVRKDPFCG
jgi:hypothetical protein